LPSKAPFSKRFEEAVGQACESAAVRRVARQFGLAASTVRAIDLRYLQRWAQGRLRPALRQMGVDEIYLGKKQKFLTVVTNLETGEPLWFGGERKKETLDEFFEKHLSAFQRSAIRAACVDKWEPFRQSLGSGSRSAGSSMTSFTFCSMPARRWTKCGGPSSSAKVERHGIW
jgi:transposase